MQSIGAGFDGVVAVEESRVADDQLPFAHTKSRLAHGGHGVVVDLYGHGAAGRIAAVEEEVGLVHAVDGGVRGASGQGHHGGVPVSGVEEVLGDLASGLAEHRAVDEARNAHASLPDATLSAT